MSLCSSNSPQWIHFPAIFQNLQKKATASNFLQNSRLLLSIFVLSLNTSLEQLDESFAWRHKIANYLVYRCTHISESAKNSPKMTLVQRKYGALKERYRCVLLKGKNLLRVRVLTVYLLTSDFWLQQPHFKIYKGYPPKITSSSLWPWMQKYSSFVQFAELIMRTSAPCIQAIFTL